MEEHPHVEVLFLGFFEFFDEVIGSQGGQFVIELFGRQTGSFAEVGFGEGGIFDHVVDALADGGDMLLEVAGDPQLFLLVHDSK